MNRIIVTFNDIIKINHILEEAGLRFKLHLHDTCGNQSFTVEPLSDSTFDSHYEDMKKVIINYFSEKGIAIQFLENGLEFVVDLR